MRKRITLSILLALCLCLFACGGPSNTAETSAPTEAKTIPSALPRLIKEEMLPLATELSQDDIEKSANSADFAKGIIGNVYTFDGIVESIEADHVKATFSPRGGSAVTGITAAVYLSPEELASIVPLQKVTFIGRIDEVKTGENDPTKLIFYSAAIVSDRFEFYGKFVELNAEAEPNTWTMQFTSSDVRAVTFVNSMDGCKGENHYYSYKEINGQYVDAYLLGPNGELAFYDPVLFNWPDIIEMASPKLTLGEVQDMITNDLTLDEVAEKIDTLADLIQYLHQKGFIFDGGDLQFWYGPCTWSVNRSAQTVFEDNVGNCGGGSNLVNYILSGDFEEQGYVKYSWNANGHITNYFKQDGSYYFFDLTMITSRGYQNYERYEMYVTDDPQKFADDYVGRNHRIYKPDSPDYLIFLSMYAWEGSHLPGGYGNVQQGWPRSYYQPKQYEDIIRILHAEGHGVPTFVEAPDKSLWPEKA